MDVKRLLDLIGADFYTGVPDSQLKPLIDYLIDLYGVDSKHHLIAANEGNSAALAAGYHLATGKIPVVYLQNSGEGNVINPFASLLHEEVYAIPVLFIIGWRGEPGIPDEPQHRFQGEITLPLLEKLEIPAFVIGRDTTEEAVAAALDSFAEVFAKGRSAAFVIQKGALTTEVCAAYHNQHSLRREAIIQQIVDAAGEDPIVCTTGKASRELFEIRERNQQSHQRDFLTVGGMGHASSIALGIALQKQSRVWCIDGDGAALMHLGAMAVLGAEALNNLVHIVINNGAHETVGGMPTAAAKADLTMIAKGCGYPYAVCVDSAQRLLEELTAAKKRNELSFIEVKCAIGARADLGRPTTSARKNKEVFMQHLTTLP